MQFVAAFCSSQRLLVAASARLSVCSSQRSAGLDVCTSCGSARPARPGVHAFTRSSNGHSLPMGWIRFVAGQLRRPRGWFGRIVMARWLNKGNRRLIVHCLDALEPESDDRILDVGFGGGKAFELLWERTPEATLLGLDFSPDMVARAERVYDEDIRAGRLELIVGDAARLPYDHATIDRILTLNTVYFWADPDAVFGEMRRVLRPNGRLIVGFRSPESLRKFKFAEHNFAKHTPDEVRSMILKAGFSSCQIEHHDRDMPLDSVIAVADA